MSYRPELQEYWDDVAAMRYVDNADWFVTGERAKRFKSHLERLQPLAEGGDDDAAYAIATILHLGLSYLSSSDHQAAAIQDASIATHLLSRCASNGMVAAFDNLVTSGIGPVADAARRAAKDYEAFRPPVWDRQSRQPIYDPQWMAGAMTLWLSRTSPSPTSP